MLKPRHVVLGLALLLALVGGSWGRSQRPPPSPTEPDRQTQTQTKGDQKKPSDDNRGTEQSPLVVKIIGTEPKAQNGTADNSESHQEKSPDWWTIGATLALVCVGLLQFVAFIVQARRLGQTINIMKDTAERQLRAYVGLKGVVTIANVAQGQKPIVTAPVGNFGQTPAYKVKLLPKTETIEFPNPVKVPGLRVVNPGNDGFEIRASMKTVLTEMDMAALTNKQAAIYFFGEIIYYDMFCHHNRTTKFRLLHEGELLGSGRMGICDEGNEAD
jgi:hypothetical protein